MYVARVFPFFKVWQLNLELQSDGVRHRHFSLALCESFSFDINNRHDSDAGFNVIHLSGCKQIEVRTLLGWKSTESFDAAVCDIMLLDNFAVLFDYVDGEVR